MKRILTLVSVLSIALTAMAHERPVQYKQLPKKAQQTIEQHFASVGFTHATYDAEIGDSNFDVLLADGTQIEFNKRGEWRKVECRKGAKVPSAMLPADIIDYLTSTHPSGVIVSVERDRNEFDVELNNGVELAFDRKGRVKWYD